MDFFCDELPPTSHCTATEHGELQTEGADHEASADKSSSMSMCEGQEQPTSARINEISRRAQDLVEKINDSRMSDQKIMDSFQEQLVEKVTMMCQQMKEHMYTVYEDNSREMEVKLQRLSEVLESCSKLDKELLEASNALACLREGLATDLAPEP